MAEADFQGTILDATGYADFGAPGLSPAARVNGHEMLQRYTGKDYDPATGLTFFNARWYSSELGRFITEDPIRDGVNWFIFCNNNPLRYVDPSGLLPTNPNAVALLADSGGSGYYDLEAENGENPELWGESQYAGNHNSNDDQDNTDNEPSAPIPPVVAPSVQTVIDDAQDGINQLQETGEQLAAGASSLVAAAVGALSNAQRCGEALIDNVSQLIQANDGVSGSNLSISDGLKFGAGDLVYGPSAGGKLRGLANSAGGRLLTDIGGPAFGQSWLEFSTEVLQAHIESGGMVRFDLTNMHDVSEILNGIGQHANTVTAGELLFIQENWNSFQDNVTFYNNGVEVAAPW